MEKSQRKNLGRRKQVKTPVAYQKHVFAKRKFSRKLREMNVVQLFTRSVIQIASSTFTYCSHISHYPDLI